MKSVIRIDLSPLYNQPVPESKYQFRKPLGKGTYAKVYEAVELKTGKRVAIKKFVRATCEQGRAKNCLRELQIMTKMDHPHIVNAKEVICPTEEGDSSICMVMEYFPLDLFNLLNSSVILEPIRVKTLLYQILLAIYYIHSAKVIHRDLKPGNILLTAKYNVKICDFGLSRSLLRGPTNRGKLIEDDIPTEIEARTPKNPVSYSLCNFTVGVRTHIKSRRLQRNLSEKNALRDFTPPSRITKKSTFAMYSLLPIVEEFTPIKSNLTMHVTTRWYRAPELILLEKRYSYAIDMWSIGCIFAELLQTLPNSGIDYRKREALFPGQCCFPLSPAEVDGPGSVDVDQIQAIRNVLGKLKEEDIQFIGDPKAKKYVESLKGKTEGTLEKLFSYASSDAFDLLKKMLEFNPSKRITAKDALAHPYFAEIRDERKEVEADIAEDVTEYARDYIKVLLSTIDSLVL